MTEIIDSPHTFRDNCSTEVITPLPVADEPGPEYDRERLEYDIARKQGLRGELMNEAIELSRRRVGGNAIKRARHAWASERARLSAASLDRNIDMLSERLRKQK